MCLRCHRHGWAVSIEHPSNFTTSCCLPQSQPQQLYCVPMLNLHRRALTIFQVLVLVVLTQLSGDAAPPFSGTIFLDADIVTPADPSAFFSASYVGIGRRQVYDRRVNAFATMDMHLVKATYYDDRIIEAQVNPEFGSQEEALVQAEKYARLVGQLPAILRSKVQTMWIHKGVQAFGGGNANLLIHTGQAELYITQGIIEETLVHEATHTSIDPVHTNAAGWVAAQRADPEFISTYARDNPTREDLAESLLMQLAFRHRKDRITTTLASTIERSIPNRIVYFDQQNFDLYPFLTVPAGIAAVTENLSVDAGQSTTLNVVTTGSVPMSYQWYLGASPDTSRPIEGANGDAFTTPTLSSSEEFWVRASNPYGPPANSPTISVSVR